MWLRGVGCFLYNTPEMIHVRNITKQRVCVSSKILSFQHFPYIILTYVSLFQTNYPVEAKKNLANFTVVLDTPEYKRVTELKTHMSDVSGSSKHIFIFFYQLPHVAAVPIKVYIF